jgi:tetratricopeptide (TPR) repeat protein
VEIQELLRIQRKRLAEDSMRLFAAVVVLVFACGLPTWGQPSERPDAAATAAKRTTLGDAVLRHLTAVAGYRELQALYDQNATQNGWTASDEGTAVSQWLAMLRSNALATTTVKGPEGRVLQFFIGDEKVTDTGISVADLDRSEGYRQMIADLIAANIASNPPHAQVKAALDRFRAHNVLRATIQEGKDAAQKKDYLSAIGYFKQAHDLALDAPEIYGYLGLTESKIAGRELRAIAWFGAYLAANPRAANAAAVNQTIAELLRTSEKNTSLLMKSWEDAVMNMPDSADRGPHTNGYRRDYALANVGMWHAWYGDLDDARRIAGLIPDTYFSGLVQTQIVETQLNNGDIEGARHTYKMIRNAVSKEAAKEKMDRALEISKPSNGVTTGVSVNDWMQLFEGNAIATLDKEMFTTFADSLRIDSNEPRLLVDQLSYVANNIGTMQKQIKRMLTEQAKQRATP